MKENEDLIKVEEEESQAVCFRFDGERVRENVIAQLQAIAAERGVPNDNRVVSVNVNGSVDTEDDSNSNTFHFFLCGKHENYSTIKAPCQCPLTAQLQSDTTSELAEFSSTNSELVCIIENEENVDTLARFLIKTLADYMHERFADRVPDKSQILKLVQKRNDDPIYGLD